jgi:hypothetical protein
MSAFVVEDRTINQVITWLDLHRREQPYLLHQIKAVTGYNPEDDAYDEQTGWPALGQAMFDLNVRAVEARYGEGEAAQFRPLDYRHHFERTTDIGVYKALQCWLYQCSEGDVPEMPLYKLFDHYVQQTIGYSIISKLPEWEAVAWA